MSVPAGYSQDNSLRIEWNSHDTVGISKQYIYVDDTREDLEPTADHADLELPDGEHSVSIHAVDHAGHETAIETSINVDTHAPYIELDEIIEGAGSGSWVWTVNDEISGVSSVEIKIDDGIWSGSMNNGSYSIEGLPAGEHTLHIRAADNAGNTVEESGSFTIEAEVENEEGGGNIIIFAVLIMAIVFFVGIAGGSVAVLVKRNRKGEEEGEATVPRTPDKLSLPGVRVTNRVPTGMRQALPPPSEKVQEATTGAGYIRPSKEDRKPSVRHENVLDTDGHIIG
jgi:hypothetical protein